MCIIITLIGQIETSKMHIQEIRSQAPFEEIDYLFLTGALKGYAQPRNKISALLKTKALIRVKKGLYVFGAKVARLPYCKEMLANLIYGPSAISLEYALSFYGFIPERVEELTSITIRRNKNFDTPLGRFSYQHMPVARYSIGITRLEFPNNHFVLFATPAKALCDYLVLKAEPLKSLKNLEIFLLEDMRVEEESLFQLNLVLISELAEHYQHSNVTLLYNYLTGVKNASSH